jgi:Na+-transporting NADH:ubiquinone oxidoreductase subunit B
MRQMSAPFSRPEPSWWNAFLGLEPGSMGETSALACLIGAVILVATGIGSWRTMPAWCWAPSGWPRCSMPSARPPTPISRCPSGGTWWLGGWAFATVFMATDPVTSPFSNTGRWIYGLMIGAMVVLIRVVNPAYPRR